MADLLSTILSPTGTSSIDNLVSQYMALERKPLQTLQAARDQVDLQTSMFDDLRTRIGDLEDAASALALGVGSVFDTHTATSSDDSAVAATASSGAANGSYLLEDVTLAKAETMHFGWVDSGWTASADSSFTLNGVNIAVAAGTTLSGLRDAINGATYAAGKEVLATIVNNTVGGVTQSTLVLTGKSTGAANAIIIVDDPGSTVISSLGAQVVTQAAADASFTINGVQVTRDRNSGLSDVVEGLSIDLKAPAAQVTIQVAGDTAGMRSKVQDFLDKYNALMDYIRDKASITKGTDDNYTRGLLYGYSLYTGLRSELPVLLSGSVAGLDAQSPTRLSDLGIEMDSNLHLTLTNEAELEDWLGANPAGVKALFGGTSGLARLVADKLEPYVGASPTGSGSYLDQDQDALASKRASINDQIDVTNERLAVREQQLRDQFTRLQNMIIDLTQQQQQLQSILSYASSLGVTS